METLQEKLDRKSNQIECRFPASEGTVQKILNAPEDDDGRSEFQWAWTTAGDRMLIVFPRGDLYWSTEMAAAYDFDRAVVTGTMERGIEAP